MIAFTSFKIQPCIFCIFRSIWSLTGAFHSRFLDYIFLNFKEFDFLGLGCFSNFWISFSLLTQLNITLFIMLAKFFPIGGPVFTTALKLLAISLMRSSSSLSVDSESSLLLPLGSPTYYYYHHPLHWQKLIITVPMAFFFVWVNANCSYPSTALSFIVLCETVIEGL